MLATMSDKTQELFGSRSRDYRLTLTTYREVADALKSEASIRGCDPGELATELLSEALAETIERILATRSETKPSKGKK